MWKLHQNGELQIMEDQNLYPPRMTLKIAELPSKPEKIEVTFQGTLQTERHMTFYFIRGGSKGRQSTHNDICMIPAFLLGPMSNRMHFVYLNYLINLFIN